MNTKLFYGCQQWNIYMAFVATVYSELVSGLGSSFGITGSMAWSLLKNHLLVCSVH
jgi:CII-binding regulator of phage lambda lysogenization HflD